MKIRTRYTSATNTGAGQIVASYPGGQRTHNYNHSFTPLENHEHAAAVLVDRVVGDLTKVKETARGYIFELPD